MLNLFIGDLRPKQDTFIDLVKINWHMTGFLPADTKHVLDMQDEVLAFSYSLVMKGIFVMSWIVMISILRVDLVAFSYLFEPLHKIDILEM